jgi:hypothetical protein
VDILLRTGSDLDQHRGRAATNLIAVFQIDAGDQLAVYGRAVVALEIDEPAQRRIDFDEKMEA